MSHRVPPQSFVVLGDCRDVMSRMPAGSADVIFADPPYFLSNGGTTCRSGERVSVNKGGWDRSRGIVETHKFNLQWLGACRRVLSPHGTLWVSGTTHVIYSVGFAMQQLGFKILNDIVWEKPNPPPNLGCRCFTHSTETILWAARDLHSKHHFDYATMRRENGDKQMKNVWRIAAASTREKAHGGHPTQKPIELLRRILRASCPPGGIVLDPFCGSGSTGCAAKIEGFHFGGIELDPAYVTIARARIEAAE